MWGVLSNFSYCTYVYYDMHRAMVRAENCAMFHALFCPPVRAHECEPPNATIMARSVNRRKPRPVYFQPRWRAGRWKAKT